MPVDTQPLALSFSSPIRYIDFVLRCQTKAVVIICSSREDFIQKLQLDYASRQDRGSDTASHNSTAEDFLLSQSFISPTIQVIASSRNVRLVYMLSLAHLRAFLSALEHTGEERTWSSGQLPILALVAPLNLHRSTGDFSAQGISRTIALAVETAEREIMHLHIVEFVRADSTEHSIVDGDGGSANSHPWKEAIPLLNGSIRPRPDEHTFAGRTVEIGSIVGKWCRMDKYDTALQ